MTIDDPRLETLRAEIHEANRAELIARGMEIIADKYPVTVKERRDFFAIDIGNSGAFMVRKRDGAIFRIKGYGVPHYACGIGVLGNVTGKQVLGHRYTYAGTKGAFDPSLTK